MADEQLIPVAEQPQTMTNLPPVLNTVYWIQAKGEPDVYLLFINMTDGYGETYDAEFVSRPDDTYGLGPTVRQWIVDHPDFPIQPYVPPTIEEIRANMAPLQRLDFKTRFKNAGMGLAKITAYFTSIEGDESHWEDMQNYYAETPTFARLAPFVVELAAFSLKTPEEIDTIWTA
jgi:hypothetical protein